MFRKKIYVVINQSVGTLMVRQELDKLRASPACKKSALLCGLTGKKTMNFDNLCTIEELGYKVMVVDHLDDIKLVKPLAVLLTFPSL